MTTDDERKFFGFSSSKQEAFEEAQRYHNIQFIRKTKNKLCAFMLLVSAMTIVVFAAGETGAVLTPEGVVLVITLNIIFLVFIYFNHRWAIVINCLVYSADKILFIIDGVGFPLLQIFFLIVILSLSYRSFLVASYIKKQKLQTQNEVVENID